MELALPAPTASGQSGPRTIHDLPLELLEATFRTFVERHIIRILSVVCKRWRRASLRCLRRATLGDAHLRDPVAPRLLLELSGLDSVTITARLPDPLPFPFALSPSVTSLELHRDAIRFAHDHIDAFARLNTLTALSFGHAGASYPLLAALLANSQSSINTLTLGFKYHDHPTPPNYEPVPPAVTALALPALTSLNVTTLWAEASFLPFMSRHAPQLVVLSLATVPRILIPHIDDVAITAAVSLPYARLRSLTLNHPALLSPQRFLLLVQSAPQLEELTAVDYNRPLSLPMEHRTKLVSFAQEHPSAAVIVAVLSKLPRLRSLRLAEHSPEVISLYSDALFSGLTHFHLRQLPTTFADREWDVWPHILRACNARSLRIDLAHRYNQQRLQFKTARPCFPHLCELRLSFIPRSGGSYADPSRLLQDIAAAAPLLRNVHLEFAQTPEGGLSVLCDVVYSMLRRGCVVGIAGASLEARLALRRWCTAYSFDLVLC